MALPSIYSVTRDYLYGEDQTPSNFLSNTVLEKGPIDEILVNVAAIMDSVTGPGRFANATQSALVASFFENAPLIYFDHVKDANGEIILTKAQAAEYLSIDSYGIDVNQAWFGAEDSDYAARTYIWGTMAFKLSDDVRFKISADGTPSIENFSIVLRDQNNDGREDFDWIGGSFIGNLGSEFGLRLGIDPSDLAGAERGNALGLVYEGTYSSSSNIYTYEDYQDDLQRYSEEYNGSYSGLLSSMQGVIDELFASGATATLYQGKTIIYGSNYQDDVIFGTVSPAGYDLSSDTYFIDVPFREHSQHGIAYVTGAGDDAVTGTAFKDVFLDGLGSDQYNGGYGVDLVSYSESEAAVFLSRVNADYFSGTGGSAAGDKLISIEALIGSAFDDVFTGSGRGLTLLSGGDGDDTFNIYTDGKSPTIVWGGAGADTVNLIDGDVAGILVVNVGNITEENFQYFDVESLGLGSNFDWSKIDVVLVNPDSSDRVELDGQVIGVRDFSVFDPETFTMPGTYTTLGTGVDQAIIGLAGTAAVNILGGGNRNLFTAVADPIGEVHVLRETNGGTFLDVEWYPDEDGFWESSNGKFDVSSAIYASEWETVEGSSDRTRLLAWHFGEENFPIASVDDVRRWFIVGGSLSEHSILANGAPTANLRSGSALSAEEPSDNIEITMLSPQEYEALGGLPSGGRYAYASEALNAESGVEVLRITYFDPMQNTVVVNGVALGSGVLPDGVTATEVDSSTLIQFGDADYVILRGISLADWQTGAESQILGTAGNETLSGTGANDVISSGGGNDTIIAGYGDDRINYTSGDDLITGGNANRGNDTLDLGRFAASDVHFTVIANDVLITTPDGTIRLGSQVAYDLGNQKSNIETILFSDGSLGEAQIRARAIADQTSTGDDSITGTAFADELNGGAGNDTLVGGSGNDTFHFTEGNDVIVGFTYNGGADTLDLQQYSAADVSFKITGADVVITMPDGTLRLQSQLSYDIGNVRSNIETILFGDGNLSEAGIKARALSDQATDGNDSIQGSSYADVISGGLGNDTLTGSYGDDVFLFESGDDVIVGGASNRGNDTLDLQRFAANEVHFNVVGNDVRITTPDGTIRLGSQVAYDLGNQNSNIENILFSDGSINEAQIRARALADQSTSGNDSITGTAFADHLSGGVGDDTMVGGAGNDTFHFTEGNDVIVGFTYNGGADTLDLQQYSAADVSFKITGADVVITMPDGTLRLQSQLSYDIGNVRSNIETILFGDGSLNEVGIKARALSDQATDGNDSIQGSIYADVISGGLGNDTMTGAAGADVFVFNSTSGADRITDFSLSVDHLRFEGFIYSDLSIAQSGANTVITFDDGDSVTLANILATNLQSSHFEFI